MFEVRSDTKVSYKFERACFAKFCVFVYTVHVASNLHK